MRIVGLRNLKMMETSLTFWREMVGIVIVRRIYSVSIYFAFSLLTVVLIVVSIYFRN